MGLALIVAFDVEYNIGNNGELLYHFKEDLALFKEHTTGKTVVMGRKTWESLPKKLPGRRNVVMSRKPVAGADATVSGINEVLKLAQKEEVWIIGGSQIYELFIEYVTRVEITLVGTTRPADSRVPFFATFMDAHQPVQQVNLTATDRLSGKEIELTFFSYRLV